MLLEPGHIGASEFIWGPQLVDLLPEGLAGMNPV
jgi:hypothetical protein